SAERGAYRHFHGSGWSKGQVPIDTLAHLERSRGHALTVSLESRHRGLNWEVLREKVKKGMRNATLMAVAPNANIGLVAGTTPGIDPRFAQVFSRSKISGKYLDLNHNLVLDLKNMGLWEKVREKIIETRGDIAEIQGIPEHLKHIYKTSFTTSPLAFIEVAARAQKWVDQALSRNMYLATRDIDETMKIYTTAWEKGLKTTYYLHMRPRHSAEQSTVRVNKAEQIGKVGFAAAFRKGESAPAAFGGITKLQPPLLTPTPTPTPTPKAEPVASPVRDVRRETFAPPVSSVASALPLIKGGEGVVSSNASPEQESVLAAVAKRPELTVDAVFPRSAAVLPEDPQEQLICDSCQ
ncbi:MAG: ribonucleoside-diphosphate reductase alpha chain, partial [Parcubacteria group bacterium Greene0416_79]